MKSSKKSPAKSEARKLGPSPVCTVCGEPEGNSRHVRYGNDVDNPVKHEFEPGTPRLSKIEVHLLAQVERRDHDEVVCFLDEHLDYLRDLAAKGFITVVPCAVQVFSDSRLTPKGYAAIGMAVPDKAKKKDDPGVALTINQMEILGILRGFGDNQFVRAGLSEFQLADLIGLWARGFCRVVDGRVVLTDMGRAALTGVPRA